MLIHRRHNQPRTGRRIPQRCRRRGHRARLITNHPRTSAALISHRTTSPGCLPRIGIQPRHPRLRLLIDPTRSSHTTTQTTATIRRRGHRPAAPTTSSKHLTAATAGASLKQSVRTSQQPIHPGHKLPNTHPSKLTGANPLRRNQTPQNPI